MATKTRTSTFISKGANFQAIVRQPTRRFNQAGEQIGVDDGHVIRFQNGLYQTDDPGEIKHLRGLESFNTEFWERGNEPGRLRPTEAEVFPLVAQAQAAGDVDRLREMEGLEREGHARESILEAVAAAIDVLEGGGEEAA